MAKFSGDLLKKKYMGAKRKRTRDSLCDPARFYLKYHRREKQIVNCKRVTGGAGYVIWLDNWIIISNIVMSSGKMNMNFKFDMKRHNVRRLIGCYGAFASVKMWPMCLEMLELAQCSVDTIHGEETYINTN